MRLTAGIDTGSTYTKAIIADEAGGIVGRAQRSTGYNFSRAAEQVLADALAEQGARVALADIDAAGAEKTAA